MDYRELRTRSENHRCAWCDIGDDMVARIERLEAELAEADALISVHQCRLDSNPRATWPKGSILEKAVARHAARAALAGKKGT